MLSRLRSAICISALVAVCFILLSPPNSFAGHRHRLKHRQTTSYVTTSAVRQAPVQVQVRSFQAPCQVAPQAPTTTAPNLAPSSLSTPVQTAPQSESLPPETTSTVNGHSHRCPSCGNVWAHTHASYGNYAAHKCPNCGTYNDIIHQQNIAVKVKTVTRTNVVTVQGPAQPIQACANGQCQQSSQRTRSRLFFWQK